MARRHFFARRLSRANDTVPSLYAVLGSLPPLLQFAERAMRATCATAGSGHSHYFDRPAGTSAITPGRCPARLCLLGYDNAREPRVWRGIRYIQLHRHRQTSHIVVGTFTWLSSYDAS